jgi:hypothetical protein
MEAKLINLHYKKQDIEDEVVSPSTKKILSRGEAIFQGPSLMILLAIFD